MRKLIISALMAATVVPTPASAQSYGEVRRSQRELQEERRELRDARQFGDRRDVREQRRDVREARQELREDRRDYRRNDYLDYRRQNPVIYSNRGYRSDYRYQQFRPGIRIQSGYYAPRYVIADYGRYRLPRPGYNQRWTRHYNDVLLIDIRRGYVVDVIRGFYR